MACDGGDLRSCTALGDILLKASGSGQGGLRASAAEGLQWQHREGVLLAGVNCLPAVVRAAGRDTSSNDKTEQATFNNKACGLDDGTGCFNASYN